MHFLDDPAVNQIARERTIFPSPVSLIYSEGSKVPTLALVQFPIFLESVGTHLACVSCCSTYFPRYFLGGRKEGLHIFQFFISSRTYKGGGIGCLPSCVFVFAIGEQNQIVQSSNPLVTFLFKVFFFFLVYLALNPHLYCKEISFHSFCSISFFFQLLVSCFYTLRPFPQLF